MKTLVLIFHPHLEQSKINQSLAQVTQTLPNVTVRNMYEQYPDFQINVKEEQKYMEESDRIILQFPIYWYSAPALVHKWEEEVLEAGWAYMGGHALDDKEFTVAASFGAGGYEAGGYSHYTPNELLRPFQSMAYRIGMKYVTPFIMTNVMRENEDILNQQINDYQNFLTGELTELAERD